MNCSEPTGLAAFYWTHIWPEQPTLLMLAGFIVVELLRLREQRAERRERRQRRDDG